MTIWRSRSNTKPRDWLPFEIVEQFEREFAQASETGELDGSTCAVCGSPVIGVEECLEMVATIAEAQLETDLSQGCLHDAEISAEVRDAFRLEVCRQCLKASGKA